MNGMNPAHIEMLERMAKSHTLPPAAIQAVAWAVTHLKEQQIKCDNLFLAMSSLQQQRDDYRATIEAAINTGASQSMTIKFLQERLRDLGGH